MKRKSEEVVVERAPVQNYSEEYVYHEQQQQQQYLSHPNYHMAMHAGADMGYGAHMQAAPSSYYAAGAPVGGSMMMGGGAPAYSITISSQPAQPKKPATTVIVNPPAAGSKQQQPGGGNAAVHRRAAGQTWEDPTLADWPEGDFRLFCGDLGNEVNEELLRAAFASRGYKSVQRVRVVRDQRTQKTKGYGFVSFSDPKEYVAALRDMNGKYVGNRPIKLRKSTWTRYSDTEKQQQQHHQKQKPQHGGKPHGKHDSKAKSKHLPMPSTTKRPKI